MWYQWKTALYRFCVKSLFIFMDYPACCPTVTFFPADVLWGPYRWCQVLRSLVRPGLRLGLCTERNRERVRRGRQQAVVTWLRYSSSGFNTHLYYGTEARLWMLTMEDLPTLLLVIGSSHHTHQLISWPTDVLIHVSACLHVCVYELILLFLQW